MGYRGLDFGSGISHYADLMAQGYKDRQDLQMRQAEIDRQMAQQKMHNDMMAYQANALYGYGNDQFGQPGGMSGVPAFDPTMAGVGNPSQVAAANGAPKQAVSQLANRNPASPFPNDPIMAPAPEAAAAPERRMVSPYENRMAQDTYNKQMALLAAQNKLQTQEAGKNNRANIYHAGQTPENKAKLAQITALAHAKGNLLAGKDYLGVPLTGNGALTRDAQIQKIDEELGTLGGGEQEASPQAKQQKPDGKYYSQTAKKTYTYQGGVVVKVEDGHT